MLEFRRLSAVRSGNPILSDVTFSVRPGSFTALLGSNGCGKSTLVACVNQQIKGYAGQILYGDQDLRHMTARQRAQKIAILPQLLPTPSVTVRELVGFGRTPHLGFGCRLERRDREIVEGVLMDTDLLPMADRYVPTLSGGERQRAYLAMIFAQEAELVLLDEPTTYLDLPARHQLLALIGRVKSKFNRTFVVVMHDLQDAFEYADDIVLMKDGKSVFCGSVRSCPEAHAVEDVFSVRQRIFHDDGKQYYCFRPDC